MFFSFVPQNDTVPRITQPGSCKRKCAISMQNQLPEGGTWSYLYCDDGHVLLDPNTKTSLVTTLTGDQRIAYLDANYLAGHMGKNVSTRTNVLIIFIVHIYLLI